MTLSTKEAFTRLFEHMCAHDGNDGHGYSQANRWGMSETETVDLGDATKVTIKKGDRDCSSGVISALSAVGVDVHGATYTGNMRACLMKTGLFDWHKMGDGYIAQRGDIYLNEKNHTAVCTCANPDTLAQFSISERGTITGQTGDQTGKESNIKPYYNYPWDGKLAWKGNGGNVLNATANSTDSSVSAGKYKVVVDSLNVRTAPGMSGAVVATYAKNQTVYLDGWSRVADGYVWGRYTGASSGKLRYIAVRTAGNIDYLKKC